MILRPTMEVVEIDGKKIRMSKIIRLKEGELILIKASLEYKKSYLRDSYKEGDKPPVFIINEVNRYDDLIEKIQEAINSL